MSSIKYCERCGKEHDGSFGSGRFCSRACANARNISDAQKQRTSNSVKDSFQKHFENGCKCEKCGNIFHSKDFSRKLCFDCLPTTIKHTKGKENPKSISDVSKRTVSKILRRLDLPCSCCGFYVKGLVLDLHHIIPKKQGGNDNMDNLTYICPNCHRMAHTDLSMLSHPLVSIEKQLRVLNKDWRSAYYG